MAYIKKEPIVEFIKKGLNNPDKAKAFGYDAIEISAEVEYTPTADVVEVVRCKDCMAKNQISNLEPFACTRNNILVYDNCFCSYGRRKENG